MIFRKQIRSENTILQRDFGDFCENSVILLSPVTDSRFSTQNGSKEVLALKTIFKNFPSGRIEGEKKRKFFILQGFGIKKNYDRKISILKNQLKLDFFLGFVNRVTKPSDRSK